MEIPRLHPDTIADVKDRVDIVDVVSEHVVLRKQGKDFVGLCPFHDDKSPSFRVSPSKQFYYCFSCGAGGNSIKFLMELGKRPFSEVVLDLANRYQIPVKTLQPEQRQELQRQLSVKEELYEILALTTRFFEHALRQPEGRAALDYLRDQRGLDETTIQQFQLGYAPSGWETLYRYLVDQKHYPVERVDQAGLIVPRKAGSYYDRFRNRLMIPIHDLQGRVIGFGGRSLGEDQPKYLNSPETPLFDKGRTLFALDKARQTIAKQDQAIVVEGYFDAIALHAAGITNAVASLGTALSTQQVKQLMRYTESKQVVFNFDADAAGVKAAERAITEISDLTYQGQVQLRILSIPEGKDPDDFLKTHSPEAYRSLLAQAPLWLDWQVDQILADRDLRQADQFQQAVQAIAKLLGKLPNTPLRTRYVHTCAELLSQGESRLALQLEENLRSEVKGQRWHGRSQKWEKPGDYTLRDAAEAQILRIYLHCPDCRQMIRDELHRRELEFSLSHHRFLWRHILSFEEDQIQDSPSQRANLDLPGFLRDQLTEFPDQFKALIPILHPDELAQLDLTRPQLNLQTAAASLERIQCEKRCRHLLKMWTEQTITSIQTCLEQLLTEESHDPALADRFRSAQRQSDLEGKLDDHINPGAAETIAAEASEIELNPEPAPEIVALYNQLNAQGMQFQKLFYDEHRYLEVLDRQRQVAPASASAWGDPSGISL